MSYQVARFVGMDIWVQGARFGEFFPDTPTSTSLWGSTAAIPGCRRSGKNSPNLPHKLSGYLINENMVAEKQYFKVAWHFKGTG